MPSSHPILRRPLLLLPSVFPSVRVFSSESAVRISVHLYPPEKQQRRETVVCVSFQVTQMWAQEAKVWSRQRKRPPGLRTRDAASSTPAQAEVNQPRDVSAGHMESSPPTRHSPPPPASNSVPETGPSKVRGQPESMPATVSPAVPRREGHAAEPAWRSG